MELSNSPRWIQKKVANKQTELDIIPFVVMFLPFHRYEIVIMFHDSIIYILHYYLK